MVLVTAYSLNYSFSFLTRCLQNDIMNAGALMLFTQNLPPIPISEDCLYLNIYTPAYASEGSNLPVSVKPCRAPGWSDIFSLRAEVRMYSMVHHLSSNCKAPSPNSQPYKHSRRKRLEGGGSAWALLQCREGWLTAFLCGFQEGLLTHAGRLTTG